MAGSTGTTKPSAKERALKAAANAEAVEPTPDEKLLQEQAQEEAAAPAPAEDTIASEAAVREERAQENIRREMEFAEREAALAAREAAVELRMRETESELPLDELPPIVKAFVEGQAAQTAALQAGLEALAEKFAGATGREVQVSLGSDGASAPSLIEQLKGTVDDGGPGEVPLEKPVVFVARGAMYKVVLRPRYRGVSPTGEQYFTTGSAADFAPTGQYQTTNPETVELLKSRPGFGTDFWIQGSEPFSAPDPKVILGEIFAAAMSLDDDELARLEADERASHKRKVVLDALELARTRVQGFES